MRSVRSVRPPAQPWERCVRDGFLTFLFLSSTVASSLAGTAQLAGVIRDAQSGHPIVRALVSLPDLGRNVFTDDTGQYVIDAAPGSQHVVISRMGYATIEFEALMPDAGHLEVSVEMRREPIRLPPIQVDASRPPPTPATNSPDRRVSRDDLDRDPLLVEPDYLRAMSGGDVVIDPENPSGLHVRGGAADQVAYVVDGIPVFNPYHSTGTFSAWNPDALSQVDLLASAASPATPDALSGTVSAKTRTPGAQHHTRGSLSATQARATVDGPLGRTRTGYLFSVTSAFPGLVMHNPEASHLDGENLDLLAKTESPLSGGTLRLIGYGSRNHINTAATGETPAAGEPLRNTFGWNSGSVGVEWTRRLGNDASLLLRSWFASGNADASWLGADSLSRVQSSRRENGAVASLGAPMAGGRTTIGVRVQQMSSAYDYRPLAGASYSLDVATPVTTVFVEHGRDLSGNLSLGVSLANAFALGETYASPTAQLRWRPAPSLTVTGTAARRHQFGQSLRNAESVVSTIFPADLYIGAGENGVPVATSNMGVLAVEQHPTGWMQLGVQVYARDFGGLALVAPHNADPFATAGFATGSGRAYGLAFEASATLARFGVLAGYGYQDVRLEHADGGYVPGYGAVHSLEAGVSFMPAPGYSVRLGYEGVMGRRSTSSLGEIEYESVNMIDYGAEFGGSPESLSGELGGASLPGYHRLDLGVRKSWHTRFGERGGVLSAFGTVSNLMSRSNVLTYAVDPATGARSPIGMRPFSPLVVGFDWQF